MNPEQLPMPYSSKGSAVEPQGQRLSAGSGAQRPDSPRIQQHPVEVGQMLDLAEEDYCYGQGRLTLRVTKVHDVQRFDDGLWVNVTGIRIFTSGTEGEERFALVRVTALNR